VAYFYWANLYSIVYANYACLRNVILRHGLFVLHVAVAAGEMPLVLVNAAIELCPFERPGTASMTKNRMFSLHRQPHLELLLVSFQTANFLNVFHVSALPHTRR